MPKHAQPISARDTSTSAGAVPITSKWLRVATGVVLIAIAACFVYIPSLRGEFILDDDGLLTTNKLVQDSDGLYRLWFTTESPDYWPLTYSTFWLEWRLWGNDPFGYRAVNLGLHIVEALLIWLILYRLAIPGAFLAALLFTVHPVNVESVAWVSQRKNTLAMVFYLLSILWYLKFDGALSTEQNNSTSRGARLWYALSLATFALALLSKGSVLILPVVLLGVTWWRRKLTKWDPVRTAPFFVLAAVFAVVNVWFQHHASGDAIRDVTFLERILGAAGTIWFYLYKALLPLNLSFVYPQWRISASNPVWWLALVAAIALTVTLWWFRNSWGRPFLFAWGYFCVALSPALGFADVGYMKFSLVADHYQHLAIIGVVALVAAGWAWVRSRLPRAVRWTSCLFAVGIVAALACQARAQSRLYRDARTLYEAALVQNPTGWCLHDALGDVILARAIEHRATMTRGELQPAIEHLNAAIELNPRCESAYDNLGRVYSNLGEYSRAIDYLKKAQKINPTKLTIYNHLAITYELARRPDEALAAANEALKIARDTDQKLAARSIEDWIAQFNKRQAKGSPK